MHGLGHALLALAAGTLAMALADGPGMVSLRSTPGSWVGSLTQQAFSLTLIGLAAVFVKGAAGVYASYVQARIAGEVGSALRLEVLGGLFAVHRLRRARHGDQGCEGAARQVAALTERVREVEAGASAGVLGGIRAAAQLVPLALVATWMAPRLAAAALVVLVPFSLLVARVRRAFKRASGRAARDREALLEASDEAVRHADLWVTYGAQAKARANVARLGEASAQRAARVEAGGAAMSAANEVLGAAALVVAMAAARAGWLGGVANGATLVAFAVVFFLAYRPLRDLAEARLALARASAAFDDLRELLVVRGTDTATATEDGHGLESTWELARLEIRSLRLSRGEVEPLSMDVAPGSIVAISGPTGVGKTTLLRTLLGLESPVEGEIVFGGVPLARADVGPRARPFAWVPQEAPLLADTLAANVALGGEALDAQAALEPIGAAHLVEQLDGARLGAAGRAVSGGERQWIALARAMATGQPVLLLDEPTSGLDARAQARVLDAIARLRGERTVLLVTHRPEPLAIADQVVRLSAGELR
jgi:ABC-type multidrug transport system fused ATPase/permease subunit